MKTFIKTSAGTDLEVQQAAIQFEHRGYTISISTFGRPGDPDLAVIGADRRALPAYFPPTAFGIADAVRYIDDLTRGKRL